MATVLANPNFPAIGYELDATLGPPNVPGTSRRSLIAPYRKLNLREFTSERGRQHELDRAQAGKLTTVVVDPLEYLNPDNPGSPFNTGGNQVTPYRCTWFWAMWPNQPTSGNVINTGVNPGYDPSFESGLGFWGPAGGATTTVSSSAQHFNGAKSMLVTQSAAGAGFGASNFFRTVPALTYTFSVYVYLPNASTTVTVRVVDASGATITGSSTSVLSTWTRLTVTWNTVDTLETITIFGTGVATPTFYVDATQLNFGATAAAFTTSGPTLYPVFTGFVERYPTTYEAAGFRAIRSMISVDALAILAQTVISQSYNSTILADSPTVFLPFTNDKPPTSGGAASTGSETAVIAKTNITGNPTIIVSPSGSLSWGSDTHPDGAQAPVWTQQNALTPPGPGGPNQDTFFDILNGGLSIDTTNGATIEWWAKPTNGQLQLGNMIVQTPGGPTNFATGTPQLGFQTFPSTGSLVFVYDPNGTGGVSGVPPGGRLVPDGKWHYLAMVFTAGNFWSNVMDGVELSYSVAGAGRLGFNVVCHVSANTGFGDTVSQASFGRWAVYGSDIGPTARLAHYNRGIGYKGEISGARITRLTGSYWAGPVRVASGFLALSEDFDYDTRTVLEVSQEIQDSERGLLYTATDGTLVFEDRESRYTNQTALWVFGENPPGASPVEYPYEDYQSDHDPTYLFSDAELTRPDNAQFAPIVNSATRAKYGQRILAQDVKCNTDADLTQAGIYYTNRYAIPQTRVSKITLNPSSNPVLWPVVLSLEISQRIRVNRRSGALATSNDYYIERIVHRGNALSGEWLCELELTKVAVPTAWVMGSSTLGTSTVPIY